MAETGFSHRFTAYKILGHFFGLSYRKISGCNQVKNIFFRISDISALRPHAQLRDRIVIKKLWTLFGPWGRDRSQPPPCWIIRVKQIHPSTASERMTRQVLVMVVNPLTAGTEYISFYHFYYHIKHYLLNMLKIKCGINQQDLKRVDRHLVKSE